MSNNELPESIAAALNLSNLPPCVPPMQDCHDIGHYPEPHAVVFEKRHDPMDQRSIDILTNIFNGKGQEAVEKAHKAEIGAVIEIQKTEMETAECLLNRVREELQSDYDAGYEGHALQFSIMPASQLTRG